MFCVLGLDTPVEAEGLVLSYGQKQLLGLARAIVEENKIIVCDEATAHVNAATEQLMQEKLFHYFSESTVLIIAHRLSTVIECDKILVMDTSGSISEYGAPYLLLKNQQGAFYSMVQNMGLPTAENLIRQAKMAYTSKQRRSKNSATPRASV